MLGHVIERAKRVVDDDRIVVCTSSHPQDRPLVDVARDHGVCGFAGSENDVLDRLRTACEEYRFEQCLGITGENPLFSISHARRLHGVLARRRSDFVNIDGLPFGCAVWGMDTRTLQTACAIKTETDTEFWGHWVTRRDVFDVRTLAAAPDYRRPDYVFSLDYPEDYALAQHLFDVFKEQSLPALGNVIHYIDERPDLMRAAAARPRLYPAADHRARIDRFFRENRPAILQAKARYYSP